MVWFDLYTGEATGMGFKDADFYKERSIRLEILRLTREIALDEFMEMKIAAHTKWLSDSEKLWTNHRQILPYPVNPLYPNEDVIMERTKTLLSFIDNEHSDKVTEQEANE